MNRSYKFYVTYSNYNFQGPENHRKPFLLVEITSFGVFDEEEKCRNYVPKIFDYITSNTELTKEQILTIFTPTNRHFIGVKGACPT